MESTPLRDDATDVRASQGAMGRSGVMMGYGAFATPQRAASSATRPPPFTPETLAVVEAARQLRKSSKRSKDDDDDEEEHHYEVRELLEREARERWWAYRKCRGLFESKRFRRQRAWLAGLPWSSIRVAVIAFLFFAALLAFVLQPAPDSGRAREPPTNIRGLSATQPFVGDLDMAISRVHRVKLYFVAPGIYNSSFTRYPPTVHLFFNLEGKTPKDDYGNLINTTWDSLDSFVHTITAPNGNEDTEEHRHTFLVSGETRRKYEGLRLVIQTNTNSPIALQIEYIPQGWLGSYEVFFGILILIAVYVLIIFELVHRAIAALVGSFWALAFLSMAEARPSFENVVEWIDFETIVFLFGMMTLVGIFSETGFFEWTAIRAFKVSGGNIWALVVMLVTFAGITSSVLDNVTEVLLVVPVTLRLCRVIDVDPLPVVIAIVVFSNIGGTATGIGDPPNILIISNAHLQATELVDFNVFTYHMAPGAALAFITTLIYFRHTYRHLFQRKYVDPVLKEIECWKRTADKLEQATTDEEKRVRDRLLQYIEILEKHMSEKEKAKQEESQRLQQSMMTDSSIMMEEDESRLDLKALERKYRIRDFPLFIKSVTVITAVIILFFIHPFVTSLHLNISWIALLGALMLLTVMDIHELEPILAKIEMGTLFFFAGLFVLMRCLEEMGVMLFFARMTADVVSIFPEGRIRLCFTLMLLVWVCALVSAFIDNIPFTTTMVPIVVELAESNLGLPLQPLVWAVAFGVCLGGNGTIIGASANVVAAGIAEQYGCHVSFASFFAMGFPSMLISTATATVYLIITHVFIPWYSG